MNDIQIFNNPEFGEIRTVLIDGEPWFVGRDIAKSLGYVKPEDAVKTHCRHPLKHGVPHPQSNKKEIEVLIVPEGDMYRLISKSKLKTAEKFEEWVFDEVLPSIRKTGGYTMPQTTDGKIALLAQGHTELKAEVDGIKADLEALKMDLPVLPIEADRITVAVKKKGVSVLGGKTSSAYNNRGLRQKVYNNLYANLKYNFGIKSYKSIKRSECDKAIEVINSYQPPFFLQQQIDSENAQQSFGL